MKKMVNFSKKPSKNGTVEDHTPSFRREATRNALVVFFLSKSQKKVGTYNFKSASLNLFFVF